MPSPKGGLFTGEKPTQETKISALVFWQVILFINGNVLYASE
jgi:hypothetical protein